MPKERSKRKAPVHDPLGKTIQEQQVARTKLKADPRKGRKKEGDEDVEVSEFDDTALPTDISRHKLEAELEEDLEKEEDDMDEDMDEDDDKRSIALSLAASSSSRMSVYSDMPDIEVDPEDEALFSKFLPGTATQTRNLADMIMAKINETDNAAAADKADARSQSGEGVIAGIVAKFDPKVVKVYKAVGRFLSRFRSGKVPKALKILPNLKDWEDLLTLTHPEKWTPHAAFAVTRIFSSNLNERMAQRFYRTFLLPAIRQWMRMNNNLAPPMYWAMFKALFKPAAFMKGFLLPLCEDGDCTLREALIFASVLQKKSIPVDHAGVVLMKIADMPYNGANSIFIRQILDKGYTLPYVVIDSLVRHFQKFIQEDRQLPVLWHQSLLCFVQRYKQALVPDQVQVLRAVMNKHTHYLITSEIRRELHPIIERIAKEKATAAVPTPHHGIPAHQYSNASAAASIRTVVRR